MANGGQTTPPDVPEDRDAEPHLDKLLSLFNEIFPDIKVKARNFDYTERIFAQLGSQGVEAQTVANLYLAMEYDLQLLPVINKIDLPAADIDRAQEAIDAELGLDRWLYRTVYQSVDSHAGRIRRSRDGVVPRAPLRKPNDELLVS